MNIQTNTQTHTRALKERKRGSDRENEGERTALIYTFIIKKKKRNNTYTQVLYFSGPFKIRTEIKPK